MNFAHVSICIFWKLPTNFPHIFDFAYIYTFIFFRSYLNLLMYTFAFFLIYQQTLRIYLIWYIYAFLFLEATYTLCIYINFNFWRLPTNFAYIFDFEKKNIIFFRSICKHLNFIYFHF